MGDTNISWCQNPDGTPGKVWNVITGCSHVSDGCRNCFAEALAKRFGGRNGFPAYQPWTAQHAAHNVVLHPERLDAPLHWRKPQRVFVNSMSDLFHEQVPDEGILDVFGVMAGQGGRHHTYLILTKRPERLLTLSESLLSRTFAMGGPLDIYPKNIHVGVSVENQRTANERVPILGQVPAAVRFLSCEPLLGPLQLDLTGINWAIIGGESGPRYRPMEMTWARDIIAQCQAAGTAIWVKQDSALRPGQQGRFTAAEWDLKQLPEADV